MYSRRRGGTTGTGLGLRVALQAVQFRGGVDARRWVSVVGVGGGR